MTSLLRCKTLLSAMVVWLASGAMSTEMKAQTLAASAVAVDAVASQQQARLYRPHVVEKASPGRKRWKAAWVLSWVAFAAVNIFDAHSSAGGRELNPLLRDEQGRFSGRRAALVKSGIGGGFFAFQWWLARRNPDENYYKTFAIATGATAAGLGVVAARNYGVGDSPKAVASPPAYLLRQP